MTRSDHNFAHAMTAGLSCYVQNLWPDWIIRIKKKATGISTGIWLWDYKWLVKWTPGLACDDGWWVTSPASCQDGAPVNPVMAQMGESVRCGRAEGSLGICAILDNVIHHSSISFGGFTSELRSIVHCNYFGEHLWSWPLGADNIFFTIGLPVKLVLLPDIFWGLDC